MWRAVTVDYLERPRPQGRLRLRPLPQDAIFLVLLPVPILLFPPLNVIIQVPAPLILATFPTEVLLHFTLRFDLALTSFTLLAPRHQLTLLLPILVPVKPTLLGRAVDRESHSIPGLATQLEHAPKARTVLEDSDFPFALNSTLELSLP